MWTRLSSISRGNTLWLWMEGMVLGEWHSRNILYVVMSRRTSVAKS